MIGADLIVKITNVLQNILRLVGRGVLEVEAVGELLNKRLNIHQLFEI